MRKASITILLVMLAACGGRQRTLTGIEKGLNTASNAFVAYDKQHQEQIVADADTEAQAVAEVKAYRAKRAKIVTAFTLAYDALALAMVDPYDTSHYIDAIMAAKNAFNQIKVLLEDKP